MKERSTTVLVDSELEVASSCRSIQLRRRMAGGSFAATSNGPHMIYVTQLIYLNDDGRADFEQFEDVVLPRLSLYGGELMLRLRPGEGARIAGTSDLPAEVHVLRFASEDGLARYSQDPERQRWLHLKERSVREAVTIKGCLV